jgi:hypothetical protein
MANANTEVGTTDKVDSGYTAESVYRLDNEDLGKLLRALGGVASIYREFKRAGIFAEPRTWTVGLDGLTDNEKRRAEVDIVDAEIGKFLFSVIEYANIEANSLVMHEKRVAFKNGEPILYWEFWGTGDLDDPSRAEYEIQKFIGLNGALDTDEGAAIARGILDDLLDGSTLLPRDIPSEFDTLGTVPQHILDEFID